MLSNKIKNILLVFITLLIAGGVFLGHANAAEVKCEDGFTKLQDSQFGYGNGPTTNTSYYEFSSESLPPIEKFVEWTHDMNAWDTLNENMSKGIDSKLVGAAEACEFYRRAAAYFSSSDNEPEAKLLKLAKCVQEDSHYVICVSYKINHQFAVGYETILRMKNYKEFDILDSALGWVWNTVINNILSGLVSIFAIILRVVGWGIEKMMELAFDMPVILIKDVWTVLRDFVNMCFALVLVGVAVMNILQVQMDNYSIKKFIPNFVAAVILVNLSWVICWLVLDVGQIAYEIVRNSINAGNQSNLVWQMISPLFGWFGIFTSGALEGMGSALLRSTYLIGAVVLLCYLLSSLLQIFFAFAARAAALWLLFAISPLAWLGFVVPEFKGQTWDKFWKNLMELAFMPAVVAFFFSLGGRIITGFADLVRKSPSYNELAGMKGMGEFAAGQANSLLGDNATTLDFWQVILIFGILIAICKLTAKAVKDNELTSELAAVGQKLFDSTVKKGLTKGRDYLWKGSEGKTGLKGVIRRDVLKTAGNWLDTKSEEHRNKYEQLMKDGSEKEAGRELLKSRLLNAPNWLAGAGTRVEQKEKKLDSLKELHMKKTVAGREKDTNMVGLEELYSARLKSLEKKLTGMRELSGQGTAIQNSSWFNKDKAVGNNSYYDLHLESEKLMQEADELKIKEKNAKDMNDLSAEKIYGEQRRAKDEEWGDVQARIEFLDNRYRNNAKSEINVKISRLQDEATLARSKGQIDVWKQKNNEIENAKKEIENLPNFSAYRNLAADWTSFQGLAKQEKQEGLLASTDQAERGRTWKDFSDQLYDTEQTEKYVRRHQENFADLVLEYANRSDVHKIRVADSQNSRIIIENEERNKIKERMKVMAGSQLRDDLIEKKIKPNIKSIQDLRDFAKKSPKIAMEWGAQALVASEKAEGEDTFGRLFVAVNQNEKDEATKRANEKEAVELLLGEEARYFDMIIGGSKDKKRSEERLQNTDKIANNAASFTGAQYNDYISKREHDGVDKYTATEEYGKMYGGDLKAWLKLLADKGQYKTFMRTKAKKFVDDMELWSALCRGMYGEDTYATEVAEMEEADDKMAESARKAARNIVSANS
ncbi:MAG: hypothetical protein NTZ80_03700 [Patescibacteria group bacterium]|nr:hypothetical protein [Patescibacteria group bacterium]